MKLELRNISIEFPGVKALDCVDFSTDNNKVHALIGANGAGKSTLMKVLSGSYSHYTGKIFLEDKEIIIKNPKDAKRNGIDIVYQEVDTALIPYLSVAENIMFDTVSESNKVLINWNEIYRQAGKIIEKLGLNLNVKRLVNTLTLAEKQLVLIARCIAHKRKIIIFDEPTAPLSDSETKYLFKLIEKLRTEGIIIIFISHRLNELYEVCNHISIMRDGKMIESIPLNKDVKSGYIVEKMMGKKLSDDYIKQNIDIGDRILEIENLSSRKLKLSDINISVHKGEVVGIAGLVGAGKTELCKLLFGETNADVGNIKLFNKVVKNNTTYDAVKNGFALVPEERRKEGIFVNESVENNLSIASLNSFVSKFSFVNKNKEKKIAQEMIKDLGIKTPSENQLVGNLSGGNQQKVAIGKWLLTDAEIFIFDEPSKGIDVVSKRDMYDLIVKVAKQGKGVIYATCEFSELINLCDRIYVMYNGKIIKELKATDTNEEELLYYSVGGKDNFEQG